MISLTLAFASAASTLIGGMVPLLTRLRELMGDRYLLGFASGAMLSVAFLEMLPEVAEHGPAELNFFALAAGFFLLYLVEKLVLIHACPEGACEVHTMGLVALIGIALESLLDGVAIAVGFHISAGVGASIALAVIAHEFPRGFTTSVIMLGSGYRRRGVLGALAVDSLFTPVGASLVLLGLFPQKFFAPLLAFAAGTFIYVGASDLLPEAHRRFNLRVILSVFLGLALILSLERALGR